MNLQVNVERFTSAVEAVQIVTLAEKGLSQRNIANHLSIS
jgi:transcriptional regulator